MSTPLSSRGTCSQFRQRHSLSTINLNSPIDEPFHFNTSARGSSYSGPRSYKNIPPGPESGYGRPYNLLQERNPCEAEVHQLQTDFHALQEEMRNLKEQLQANNPNKRGPLKIPPELSVSQK